VRYSLLRDECFLTWALRMREKQDEGGGGEEGEGGGADWKQDADYAG